MCCVQRPAAVCRLVFKAFSIHKIKMRLIALCASHIDCYKRLCALHRMLNSVAAQTISVDLYLSISGAHESTIETIRDHGAKVHVFARQAPLTQFQHYKLLCADLLSNQESVEDVWCMFTDDDDVWNERRVEAYLYAIKSSVHDVVVCAGGRMHNGRLVESPIEYFEYAARFTLFKHFFDTARPALLELRGCDLIWRNVLRSQLATVFRPFDTAGWLYWHETPEERMDQLWTYIGETKQGWQTYLRDTMRP